MHWLAPQCYLRLLRLFLAAPPLSPPCSDRSWTCRRRWCRCGCCHGWRRGCRCRDVERMPSLASISRLEEVAAKGVTMFLGRLLRGTDPLDGPDSSEYRWRWTTGARKTDLLRLSLLLLWRFSCVLFLLAAAPATSVSTSALPRPLARLIVVCFLPRWLHARAEQKHLREFFSQMCRSNAEVDVIGESLSQTQFQGTECVCSALEQLL